MRASSGTWSTATTGSRPAATACARAGEGERGGGGVQVGEAALAGESPGAGATSAGAGPTAKGVSALHRRPVRE